MGTSIYKGVGNSTTLTFCRQDVDPEMVTRLLNWVPSESYKVGDARNGRVSAVGLWQLALPNADPADTVEMQLAQWLDLLRGKSEAFHTLHQTGYSPYLDCKAESRSLSLCIDPDILTELGSLQIALSIWLYEYPANLET